MTDNNLKIQQILSGKQAFYNEWIYHDVTKKEMTSPKPLNPPIYTYNTESKVWRLAQEMLSIIIFPVAFYRLMHSIAGKIIVPASGDRNYADRMRNAFLLNKSQIYKTKRISVEMDGWIIDAAILCRAPHLENGRWLLSANGNHEFYEDKLHNTSFSKLLYKLNSNAIIFNYPGVGCSTGMPHRHAMAKAYRAMLTFLEDQEKGIGAKEIIGYGHSIGGGVQGEALLCHELKQGIKYVFVKNQTFSDLSSVASNLIHRRFGSLVRLLGWNISSVESSKKLKAPEIIIQTADVSQPHDLLGQAEKIKDDGVISAEASLAKKLLDDKEPFVGKKYFMGIVQDHNECLNDPGHLVDKINEMLKADETLTLGDVKTH
ncbi:MAG: CPn0927/CPn0928 family alpha/beta hydrolase fold protein [Parachlamydiaceae bacterium]